MPANDIRQRVIRFSIAQERTHVVQAKVGGAGTLDGRGGIFRADLLICAYPTRVEIARACRIPGPVRFVPDFPGGDVMHAGRGLYRSDFFVDHAQPV